MSTFDFTIYGGYDQISQALTMMSLIFHNNDYNGLWYGIAVLGLAISGLSYYFKTLTTGQAGGGALIPWLWKPVIGIVLMLSLIRNEGGLQVMDNQTGQSQMFQIPLYMAATMGMLNKIENGMVNIIASVGDVNSPNDYRKFSGGAGFDLFTQDNIEHKNLNKMQSLQSYYEDCFLPGAAAYGQNISMRDFVYGDLASAPPDGFFDMLSAGASPVLEATDYTVTPPFVSSCQDLYFNNIFPYFSNPNSFQDDANMLCKQNGYDIANAASLAECKSKMTIILGKLTNKTMTAEDYLRLKTVSKIAMSNLNEDDGKVMMTQASKNLQVQGAGISAVVTKFAPVIRSIMWVLVIMLFPLCALFIVTPYFPKVFSFTLGLMVLLVSWTIIDCALHTAMQYYVANKFQDLRGMGKGTMFFVQMPNAAAEAVAFFGLIKGSSLMIATAFAGMFGLQGSHAMTQLAGGLQGSLQSAGQQAGQVAFTPEGRAQAIQQQHTASESLTSAHKFNPNQMFEKGAVNAEHSYGEMDKIKRGHQEAIAKGLMPPNSTIAEFSSEMGFRSQQNQIGGLKSQDDGIKAAKKQGIFPQDGNLTDFVQASGNSRHSLVGTDGKAYTMAVDQSGNAVWSDTKAGHSNTQSSNDITQRTEHFDKTNLGGISTHIKSGINNQKSDMIATAERQTTQAADNYNDSTTATRTQENAFVDGINNSTAYSDAEKKTITNGIRASQTVSDADVKRLSQSAKISESAARATLTQTQVALNMSAGVGVPTNPVFKADMAASLTRSGAFTDTKSAMKALDSVDDSSWSHQKSAAQERHLAIQHAHDLGTTRGDTKTLSGSESLRIAEGQQVTAGTSLTESTQSEKDLRQSIQTMEHNGVENSMSGDAMLYKNLENKHGVAEASRMVMNWNNAVEPGKLMSDKTAIQSEMDDMNKQYASEVYTQAGTIKADREQGTSTIQAGIAEKQVDKKDLAAVVVAGNNEVNKQRKSTHVEKGHKVKTANTEITTKDMKTVDAKFKSYEPAQSANYKATSQMLEDKWNTSKQGDVGAVVAAFTTPDLGDKAAAFVGKLVGVSAPNISKEPKDKK